MSSAQQVTVSFDYDAYVRADDNARRHGTSIYAQLLDFLNAHASEETDFTSDRVLESETVMRSPEDVRAHFNGLMREALQDV